MRSVCVFCGSKVGTRPVFRQAAEQLGHALSEQGISVVYGGGAVGLMGILADATLERGGEVIGVIPDPLATKEVAHHGLSELHVVTNMHQRKAKMAELSEGFIALPGGFGTLEELFEAITWAQLQIHHKPIGLLNLNGYYDQLLGFIDGCVAEGFIKPHNRDLFVVDSTPEQLLGRMREQARIGRRVH